jgi:hypothetical protein
VQYQIVLSNGVVTSFTNFAAGTAVSQSNSRYQLRLASPSAIGTVNSNVSYAGKWYRFQVEKTATGNLNSYPNGKIRSDNKIYITAATRYGSWGYIWANEAEDWSKRGYSKETFTASQLAAGPVNFTINPPAAKITGQVSGSFGPGSYAQIQPLVNGAFYRGFDKSPLSSDGHFGFQKPDDRFETFTVKVFAYDGNGVRAISRSSAFAYKQSDTKTVSNLAITLPENNVSGLATIKLIGAPNVSFRVSKLNGNGETLFSSTTDYSGRFNLGLAPDTYTLTFYGGYLAPYATTSVTCVVKSGSNTCDVALTPPTVIGKITGIPELLGGSVEFSYKSSGNFWGKPSYASITPSGNFYGFMAPGTYSMRATVKAKNAAYSLPVGNCIVSGSATATCNIEFTSGLTFKLINFNGENFSGALGMTVKSLDSSTSLSGSKTTIKYSPTTGFNYPLVPGKYSITFDPHSNSAAIGAASEFEFEYANGVVTSAYAVESQTVIAPTNGVFTFRLAKPQFEAVLLTNSGGAVSQPARVWLRSSDGANRVIGMTSETGVFVYTYSPRLADGTYSIWSTPLSVWKSVTGVESKRETFTITNGFAARRIEIRENAPNVSGTLRGPNGPLTGIEINVTSIEMKKLGYYYPIRTTTDSNGRYSVYLPQGQNYINIYGSYVLGVVNLSQLCDVTDTATICDLLMKAPNVIEKMTVAGKSYDFSEVSFRNSNNRNEVVYAQDYWGDQSQFAAYAPAGKYRPFSYIYYRDSGGSTIRTFAVGNECIVPETGTATCVTDFAKPNLQYSIFDYKGIAPIAKGSSTLLEVLSDSNDETKNIYFNGSGAKNSDKNYLGFLSDGSYRISLQPNGKDSNIGNTERYLFDITNGNVSNMRVDGSTEILQPVNGAYQLKLKSPAISGRIFGTDGTTPIAYTEVRAELNGAEFYDQTDSNGYFSFDLGSPVKDGTYQVSARGPYNNPTQAESARVNVVVTNGIGSAINISLRTPNLVGVVSGPFGASRNNWINVYRLYASGKGEYIRWGQQSTDNLGRFGFRLDPGEYSISTNDDMQFAGGTAVRNYKCVVPETGTVSCNISLIAPNVRGTFTKAGEVAYGSIEFQKKNSTGGYEYTGVYTYTKQNGWYAKLEPGSYRARAYSWNDQFTFFSRDFLIQDTSTVNVAIEIPAVNFTAQVVSAAGVLQSSPTSKDNVWLTVFRVNGTDLEHIGSVQNYGKSQGVVPLRFSDGQYQIQLSTNNAQLGTYKSYAVRIESGTVTSTLELKTGIPVVKASNGSYQLQMGQPTISGTVVAPNGTTPVPGATVGYFEGDRVCPWCERGWANTGNNGYFGFGEVPDGQYQIYATPGQGDISKGKSDLTSVTINGGQPQNGIVLALRNANVTGTIQGLTGRFDAAYLEVRKIDSYGSKNVPVGVYGFSANAQGNFGVYLEPGTYKLVARIYTNSWSSNTSGFSQECVVPSTGTITCDVTLNTSNISVKIVTPGTNTVMSYAGLSIYSTTYAPNLTYTNPQASVSNSGIFSAYLENSTWTLRVDPSNNSSEYSVTYYTATVENGVVVRVENESGETLTAVNGIFSLTPKLTNLRGAITFNGSTYSPQAYIRVQSDMNGWWREVAARWVYNGNFGFNIPPGTYRIVVDPYSGAAQEAPVVTTVYDCVVASSGISTCNVALSAGNLSGRIVDENGQLYRQAYINLYQIGENGNWDYIPISANNSIFKANLANGKYQVTVVPYWEVRGNYTERNYEILVSNNVVTQVRDSRTNDTVTAVNGSYDFVLGMPAIRGRVLAPGTSTQGVQDVEIRVGVDRTMRDWQYGTRSANNGSFALTVPDGTYVIQAVPFGSKTRFGKSETQTVVVLNGSITTPLTLRLREPNFFGRVVTPGASPSPVSGVNVNIWIDSEYFYTYTGSDGVFAAYVEQTNPNCPNSCSMSLNYYGSTDYSSKNYRIDSIGDIGDKALGGVSTRARVLAPATGAATTANRYGYVAIEHWNSQSSQYEWQPGYQTNELGLAGLSLEVGEKYRLTAYPGEGNYALFSPKVTVVESFSAIDSPTITIIFDRPNISLQVRNIAGVKNMWGWYQISKYNGNNGRYEYFKDGYLDEQGKGALLLPQGDFSIHFWPGKISAGVEKEILVSVDSASVVTGINVSNGIATVVLPNGNVSGFVRNQSAVGLNAVVITAVRDNDPTKMISTVSGSNGYYELNLDRTYAWTIKAIEPISASNGQYALATDSPSNAATSSANITINITS